MSDKTAILPDPVIISTPDRLKQLTRTLARETLIAFDTESNSLFAYKERVCLIQVSTRTADYLIDPLALPDLEPLRSIFADAAIEKVFHAAEYDLMCMKRDYDFSFANLFDTMFAARIVGRKAFGLGALLEEFFGIQADKRFQRADWSLRPIPPEQLRYAQQDTHYLPQIRDILHAEIEAKNRLREAEEVFDTLTRVPPAENNFDPEGYWRINSARDFSRRQMAMLRELYLWRDDMARHKDVPPFKIMGDNTLTALVVADPHGMNDLWDMRDIAPGQVRRFGHDLLQALQIGASAALPRPPQRPPRVEPLIQARYDALHQWRKDRAAERGVESDIILSKESMWAMARNPPTSSAELDQVIGLGTFRREEYGEALIRVVAEARIADDQAIGEGEDDA